MPNKQLTDHHDGHGLNESIVLTGTDEVAGVCHRYGATIQDVNGTYNVLEISFQRGPRNVEGSIPGVTEMAVIAVVIDRLRGHQAGPYATRENAIALTKCEEALMWMRQRADNRAKRGVLGTNQK